jgi:hypothetical protein
MEVSEAEVWEEVDTLEEEESAMVPKDPRAVVDLMMLTGLATQQHFTQEF